MTTGLHIIVTQSQVTSDTRPSRTAIQRTISISWEGPEDEAIPFNTNPLIIHVLGW